MSSLRNNAVEVGEFARFVVTGVAATIGNIAAVWLARLYWPFRVALLVGIVAAATISFILSKWFAFRSRSIKRAPGEMARFLMVYAASCTIYWGMAVTVATLGRNNGLNMSLAEAIGIFAGAGVMMVTSYLGHRFFTYRTYARTPTKS